jgi:hypothetical protein
MRIENRRPNSIDHLQPELNLPRAFGGKDLAGLTGIDKAVRQVEVRMIEKIKELGAELDVFAFTESAVLYKGKINRV